MDQAKTLVDVAVAPPLFLDDPETQAVPKTMSQVVRSLRHARAVQTECVADGVECIVRQDHAVLKPRPVEFLLAMLRAKPAFLPATASS